MRSDFFAHMSAIERARGQRIGAARPADEPVRFVPDTALAFAANDCEPLDADARTWRTRFLCLSGADGALPPHLTEEIADEDPERAVREMLLAPFHHRATSLLYRAVHRCRVPEETRAADDAWPTRLAALVRGDCAGDAFERELALVLAPILAGPASAASLLLALRVVSRRWLGGAAVSLREHTGGRVPIDADARARLGRARLGDTAVLGASVLDPSSRATIAIGPVDAAALAALCDRAPARRALGSITRWLGDAASELEIVVLAADAAARIGRARLGTSALGTRRGLPRTRRLALDATPSPTCRHRDDHDGAARPAKELPCDPIPARSSSV